MLASVVMCTIWSATPPHHSTSIISPSYHGQGAQWYLHTAHRTGMQTCRRCLPRPQLFNLYLHTQKPLKNFCHIWYCRLSRMNKDKDSRGIVKRCLQLWCDVNVNDDGYYCTMVEIKNWCLFGWDLRFHIFRSLVVSGEDVTMRVRWKRQRQDCGRMTSGDAGWGGVLQFWHRCTTSISTIFGEGVFHRLLLVESAYYHKQDYKPVSTPPLYGTIGCCNIAKVFKTS